VNSQIQTKYLILVWFLVLLICLLIALTGCMTLDVTGGLDPKVYYRHDLEIEVNGQKAIGVMTAKRAKEYAIKIYAEENIDYLLITTCHRQFTLEQKIKGMFVYVYFPQEPIETSGSCPMRIEAFEKKKFLRYSSAFIEFENRDTTLNAVLVCNGETKQVGGASICQSWKGLEQMILFPTLIKTATPDPECNTMESVGEIGFRWHVAPKECVYLFRELSGRKRLHRLQSIGYEEIAIKGD